VQRAVPAEPPAQAAVAAVATRPAPPQIHPRVQTAYAAYLKGDLAAAQADYQEAAREQPNNRDALLGLAAIDVRTGRLEAAEATYLRLLQLDPGDAHAQAGLIALRASRLDPLATESRVKSMLAADPGAHVLHFTLGNQLAQQARWEEAQQEYFKAFAASPDNADFAYNLAVSLDHLRQRKPAAEYYRRAVSLAQGRGASFDPAAAQRRAAELEK
jgi:tetratricopeptide (TPR) repeat protein